MYNICISILCIHILRGTGHLVEKERTSHCGGGGGVTQTTAEREQGRGESRPLTVVQISETSTGLFHHVIFYNDTYCNISPGK